MLRTVSCKVQVAAIIDTANTTGYMIGNGHTGLRMTNCINTNSTWSHSRKRARTENLPAHSTEMKTSCFLTPNSKICGTANEQTHQTDLLVEDKQLPYSLSIQEDCHSLILKLEQLSIALAFFKLSRATTTQQQPTFLRPIS